MNEPSRKGFMKAKQHNHDQMITLSPLFVIAGIYFAWRSRASTRPRQESQTGPSEELLCVREREGRKRLGGGERRRKRLTADKKEPGKKKREGGSGKRGGKTTEG